MIESHRADTLEESGRRVESIRSSDVYGGYFRSMNKVSMLNREQEGYLALRIESAKLNILRLLSMTPVSSHKVLEIA
jgi:hypothetical protein